MKICCRPAAGFQYSKAKGSTANFEMTIRQKAEDCHISVAHPKIKKSLA